MYVGADEAGKGPVLGPMIAAAVRGDSAALPEGLADSKRLSSARREELDAALRTHPAVQVATAVVPVERIDDPKTDMNRLGVAAQAEAVAQVAADGDAVLADAADVSEERFARRLRERLGGGAGTTGVDVTVTAEHGADETYDVVSAASIVAKVERDRQVTAIDDEHDRDVGSGYPSDSTTREFLRAYVDEHEELPDCARRSWGTCEELLAKAEQSALSEF